MQPRNCCCMTGAVGMRPCRAAPLPQQSSVAYASDADITQAALHRRLKAAGFRVHR